MLYGLKKTVFVVLSLCLDFIHVLEVLDYEFGVSVYDKVFQFLRLSIYGSCRDYPSERAQQASGLRDRIISVVD